MLYNKANLAVSKCASKDNLRRNLNGVYFTNTGTVATDGHKLVIVDCPKDLDVKEYPNMGRDIANLDKGIICPLDTVKDFKLPKNGRASLPILNNFVITKNGNGRPALSCTDLETFTNKEFKPVDSDYPDYKQVIPNANKYDIAAEFAINAQYLIDVLTVLKEVDTGITKAVKFTIYKEPEITANKDNTYTPIKLEVKTPYQDATAVLMQVQI